MAQIPKDDPRYKLLHPYTMGKKATKSAEPAKNDSDSIKIDFKSPKPAADSVKDK